MSRVQCQRRSGGSKPCWCTALLGKPRGIARSSRRSIQPSCMKQYNTARCADAMRVPLKQCGRPRGQPQEHRDGHYRSRLHWSCPAYWHTGFGTISAQNDRATHRTRALGALQSEPAQLAEHKTSVLPSILVPVPYRSDESDKAYITPHSRRLLTCAHVPALGSQRKTAVPLSSSFERSSS